MNTHAVNLAASRLRISKSCMHCGKAFEGLKIARYCGESCRQKAKYRRTVDKIRNIHLSQQLGLSRPYDWSNPNLPESVFLLRVLEGADIADIARCVQRFGSARMQAQLERIDDPLTLRISTRKLRNAIMAVEEIHAKT